jgi:ADP-heptose:LPS heptosyltransferase
MVAAQALRDSGRRVLWLVRSDFADLLRRQGFVDEVIAFDRRQGLWSLLQLSWQLASRVDEVYDAHANLRSFWVRNCIRLEWICRLRWKRWAITRILVRPKYRWIRLLYLRLGWRSWQLEKRGAVSFLTPLKPWLGPLTNKRPEYAMPMWQAEPAQVPVEFANWVRTQARGVVALAPSAAWPNKRWPLASWIELVKELGRIFPGQSFLVLGGPQDQFAQALVDELGPRAFNSIGRWTLAESAHALSLCRALIANDTGFLHVADRLQLPHVAIIGPTAFGFTVSPRGRTASLRLDCQPCSKDGRDRCRNRETLKCLRDLHAVRVVEIAKSILMEQNT